MTSPAALPTRNSNWFRRAGLLCWWVAPVLLLFWLHYGGFKIWWREDDFSLFGFVAHVGNFQDLLNVLFSPYAQGTIRPWSERVPFLLTAMFFGTDCLPLRIAVFCTAAADLLLIAWVVRRMTESRAAGLAAACFWAASPAIVSPMTWNSSYNEVQSPLFLLGALALFIRYGESGRPRFWWWQLLVFILGFGSLENNVVYPALAMSWALFMGRRQGKKQLVLSTLPLWGISVIYFFIHRIFAPPPTGGIYAIHMDWRIAATFWEYWRWAFLSPEWLNNGGSVPWGMGILVVGMGAIVLFAARQMVNRKFARARGAALFCLAWFLLTLAPMLPLPDRHSEYYLAVPVIGLAMLAGWGVAHAWRAGGIWRVAMILPAAAWFAGAIPMVRATSHRYTEESRLSRNLVLAVEAARVTHPRRAIVLDGMTEVLYRVSIQDGGFHAVGVEEVYLTPGSETTIQPGAADENLLGMTLDPAVLSHAIAGEQAVVYSFNGDHLRNITGLYGARYLSSPDVPPRRVEVGRALYSWLLGPEWTGIREGVRWMPDTARVTIGGPVSPGDTLTLNGYCTEEQLRGGPLRIRISADGVSLGDAQVFAPETHFRRAFPLPTTLTGRRTMELTIGISPSRRIGNQNFGALFGSIAIHRP